MQFTRNFKLPFIILLYLLHRTGSSPSVLSTVDLLTSPVSLYWSESNTVGISYDFQQFLSWASSPILLSRSKITIYGGWMGNIFSHSFHVPRGYKYNCSSTIYGATVTCTKDLILNTSQTSTFTKFVTSVSAYGSVDIGIDIQKKNFSKTTYYNNFKAFFNLFGNAAVNPQILDYGDLASTIYNTTFGISDYLNDLSVLSAKYFPPYINGPGITENADNSWVSALSTINLYYSIFTFRCIVFKNLSDVTIPNLMSQNYSEQYLRKRLVDSSGKLIDMAFTYYIGINDIRLVSGSGVDGVTNTFAAAIWALDTAISFASLGGSFIQFHNFFTSANYQSLFGPGPGFQPQPIYYGILFATLALKDQPNIQSGIVTAGSSSNIKSFGLDNLYGGYRILLMNKDLNASASGFIRVKMRNQGSIRCMYLSAPSLQSTHNITIAGMYFIANNSDYQGLFQFREYIVKQGEDYFSIQLNYSQAVICEGIDSEGLPTMKRMKRKALYSYVNAFLPIIIIISLII